MAMTWMSSSFFLRLALARSSEMEMPAVSSMNSLQSAISAATRLMRFRSSILGLMPSRRLVMAYLARANRRRWTIWAEVISHENTMEGSFWSRQMCSIRFITKEVLPMDGRAAMMNISPGLRPLDISSSLL